MGYIGTVINDSPVIAVTTAEDIESAAFKAVKFDENGNVVLAGEGDTAIGIVTAEFDNVSKGDDVTVQIKDIGMCIVSEDISAGAELSCGAKGEFKVAATGDFVMGFALEATTAGSIARVQVTKSGYKA